MQVRYAVGSYGHAHLAHPPPCTPLMRRHQVAMIRKDMQCHVQSTCALVSAASSGCLPVPRTVTSIAHDGRRGQIRNGPTLVEQSIVECAMQY
jgi:hypothetical protein